MLATGREPRAQAHRCASMTEMAISVSPAGGADAAEIADLAAATFPLACPPSAAADDIAAFVGAQLSARCFGDYLADPDRVVLIASDDGRMVGYTMLVRGIGEDPGIARAVPHRPAVEVSKMYVAAGHHGTGAAGALMRSGISWAAGDGAAAVWLGVNRTNARAQRFYRKHGFAVAGTRTFRLGSALEDDFVMVRVL